MKVKETLYFALHHEDYRLAPATGLVTLIVLTTGRTLVLTWRHKEQRWAPAEALGALAAHSDQHETRVRPVSRAQAEAIVARFEGGQLPPEDELFMLAEGMTPGGRYDPATRSIELTLKSVSYKAIRNNLWVIAHTTDGRGFGVIYYHSAKAWRFYDAGRPRSLFDSLQAEKDERAVGQEEAEAIAMRLFGVGLPDPEETLRIGLQGVLDNPRRPRERAEMRLTNEVHRVTKATARDAHRDWALLFLVRRNGSGDIPYPAFVLDGRDYDDHRELHRAKSEIVDYFRRADLEFSFERLIPAARPAPDLDRWAEFTRPR